MFISKFTIFGTRSFIQNAMASSGRSEHTVIRHYATPDMLENLVSGLKEMGKSPDTVVSSDLNTMDEFHMGGAPSTMNVLQMLDLSSTDKVLDVGCGIGGTTRTIATNFPVSSIDGIDLTPDYVDLGNAINSWPLIKQAFINDKIPRLQQGSALALPYSEETFTKIVMLHVGMNIKDKAKLFQEFTRVLKPGGKIAVFDVMRISTMSLDNKAEGDTDIQFPVPWAASREHSFVESPAYYKELLKKEGLRLLEEQNHSGFILQQLEKPIKKAKSKADNNLASRLNLRILMGENIKEKMPNLIAATKAGILAPILLICQKPLIYPGRL